MKNIYLRNITLLITGLLLIVTVVSSCRKDSSAPAPAISSVNFAKLGLYELIGGTNRRIFLAINQVGTQKVSYASIFDTGSTGMTIDANGILPASMITSTGIQVTGDSVNVNGITITTQQAIITYGDQNGSIQEYGNLAYAPVTIGDPNGNLTTPRIPIFLYYKIIDVTTGQQLPAHSNDVFGVGPGVSFANRNIGSPLSYFKLPAGVTNGYRLARLNSASFSTTGTYVPSLLYIGLTSADLNSGFIMHPLSYSTLYGYSANIASTVTYNGTSIPATILFDTGTPSVSTIENNGAASNVANLPAGTTVTITTNQGFSYQYTTTATNNLTQVKKPSYSGDPRTIFSVDFFINNQFLMDYTNHQIGLKNN